MMQILLGLFLISMLHFKGWEDVVIFVSIALRISNRYNNVLHMYAGNKIRTRDQQLYQVAYRLG
jgi:aromatic ring-cleaving dioxygenase